MQPHPQPWTSAFITVCRELIAETLFISAYIMHHHLYTMYQKLRVSSNGDAVAKARQEFSLFSPRKSW
jgi:hypothetical protein